MPKSAAKKKTKSKKLNLRVTQYPDRDWWLLDGTAVPFLRDIFDRLDSMSCRSGWWSTRSSRTAHLLDICSPALVALAMQRAGKVKP